uniref:Uncharacterized protein n=1 Tax=Clastoptera arizonana TaxID=38151 RepID=A0A1B6D4N8_9HEMI
MELMEEGNLMDRVRILIQRDSQYYENKQVVLQENLCVGVVGGLLDFPHYSSFAAVKMIMWWEEEYVAAFRTNSILLQGNEQLNVDVSPNRGCGGVVSKTSSPQIMIQNITACATQLLDHLHTLSQESLDHADLQVLTGTLGAAALIKNCLWIYNQHLTKIEINLSLTTPQKKFQEMAESLAERLLDLHCRLISLYILQDADCLKWEDEHAFFESERGSYTIQMWWLYIQGTKSDLWNTVPPKTAQRVLAGTLNESLTILTIRYNQAKASAGRARLLMTDICNILQCVRQILPSLCYSAYELLGISSQAQVIVRDVHAKCHELLTCLLLRGSPLSVLHKVFHKGLTEVQCFKPLSSQCLAPWVVISSPEELKFGNTIKPLSLISLELSVLLAQPQPSWSLLLKILLMNQSWVASRILTHLITSPCLIGTDSSEKACSGFLCSGSCKMNVTSVEKALVHILVTVGTTKNLQHTLLPMLESIGPSWAACLDKKQVWNQKRPAWLHALTEPLIICTAPVINIIKRRLEESVDMTVNELITMVSNVIDSLPDGLLTCCSLLTEFLPADINPICNNVLIQIIISCIYSELVDLPISEMFCNITDDQMEPLLKSVKELIDVDHEENFENSQHVCEIQVSKLLFSDIGCESLKILYNYLKLHNKWLIEALGVNPPQPNSDTLLYTMFHIGGKPFDQLLSDSWIPDWFSLLNVSLGLNPKFVWEQLQLRPEFYDGSSLSAHDQAVVKKLQILFSGHSSSE